LEFRSASECYVTDDAAAPSSGTPSISSASLWVDYVFLDTEERRQFSQIGHEYLIDQLQFTGEESFSATSAKSKLAFNHPCKELVFAFQLDANTASGANRWTDYTDNGAGSAPYAGGNPLVDAKLLLNGHDRFAVRPAAYFNLVQPYQHHTRIPATGVYIYSFALKPEEHQPSGTLNMSRIDNATLQLSLGSSAAGKLSVFATNYNVLRILSGMGGLRVLIIILIRRAGPKSVMPQTFGHCLRKKSFVLPKEHLCF
jgi:hypothetical protein